MIKTVTEALHRHDRPARSTAIFWARQLRDRPDRPENSELWYATLYCQAIMVIISTPNPGLSVRCTPRIIMC